MISWTAAIAARQNGNVAPSFLDFTLGPPAGIFCHVNVSGLVEHQNRIGCLRCRYMQATRNNPATAADFMVKPAIPAVFNSKVALGAGEYVAR